MRRQYALGLVVTLSLALLFTTVLGAEDFKTKSLAERTAFIGEVEYVKGEVLVKYREGVPQRQMTQMKDLLGLRLLSSHRGGVQKLSVPAGKTEQEVIAQLQADPNVEFAQLNTVCYADMIPNDPYYDPYQWHFPIVNCHW